MSATQNFQSDLFKGQFSGFQGYMEARTEYGTLISLDRLKNGKFIVTEYKKGKRTILLFLTHLLKRTLRFGTG